MRIAVVVEHGWDPASVEVDPLSGVVDQTRTVAEIGDPSRSAVALALRLRGPDGRVEVLTAAPAAADDELRGLLGGGRRGGAGVGGRAGGGGPPGFRPG